MGKILSIISRTSIDISIWNQTIPFSNISIYLKLENFTLVEKEKIEFISWVKKEKIPVQVTLFEN